MRSVALTLLVTLLSALPLNAQRRSAESPAAALYREGMQLLSDEHWQEAADTFQRAIDLDARYGLAFYGLGRARIGAKQYGAAVAALERSTALFLAEARERAIDQRGFRQSREDRIRELEEQLRNLGPQGRNGPSRAANEIQDQIQDLQLSMRDGIGDLTINVPAFVWLSLGSAHFRNGSMTNAERAYRNAIVANSGMGEAHNNLAVVLLVTGRAADAEKSIRTAERSGFTVSPQLKQDIQIAMRDERR